MEIELQNQIQDLQKRLEAVESKTGGIQQNAFLNQITIDPQSASFLKDFIALPYSTTIPTFTPPKNGYEMIVNSGGAYYLYVYANGAWRSQQLGGSIVGRTYLSSAQGVTSTFNTKITFDTNDYATGITWDGANNRFTALTAGKYIVSASLQWSAAQNFQHTTKIYKNGSPVSQSGFISGTYSGVANSICTDLVTLAVGDYIEVYAIQYSAGTLNVNGGSNVGTFLSIALQ